jgi:transposase
VILSSAIRAHVYSEAVDMRKSIDALAQIVSRCMGMNPLSGQVFGNRPSNPVPRRGDGFRDRRRA